MPILSWVPAYQTRFLRFDVIAGATIWGLLVPESIAYAGLAGLAPQAGLYTLLATLAAYAIFGTSGHVVVGATSAAAVLLASSVAAEDLDHFLNSDQRFHLAVPKQCPAAVPAGRNRAMAGARVERVLRL